MMELGLAEWGRVLATEVVGRCEESDRTGRKSLRQLLPASDMIPGHNKNMILPVKRCIK